MIDEKWVETLREKGLLKPSKEKILGEAERLGLGERARSLIKRALEVESIGNLTYSVFGVPVVLGWSGGGAVVYDVDGKEYIDMMAGFAVSNAGHARRDVLEAIREQWEKIVQYSEQLSETRVRLSEKLVEVTPGRFKKKVFYELTGSGAVEVAIKLMRYYTLKPIIITQYGDYHGRTVLTAGFTHTPQTTAQIYPVPPMDIAVHRIPFPYAYRCPFFTEEPAECARRVVRYLRYLLDCRECGLRDPVRGVSNVSGLLIEPYQSAAGYIIPPDNYLGELWETAKEYQLLFVDDEVQAGWARTGKMWAVDHYGVEPDLVVVGKSIANGLPFSAVVGREEILDSWGTGGHSSTFAGYFVGCAAALATIEAIEKEKLHERASRMGEEFLRGLNDIKESRRIVGDVQMKGLYGAIELVRERRLKKPAVKETSWVIVRLLQLGLLAKKAGYFGNRITLSPPLTITREQIERAIELFDRVFREAEEKFL